MTSFFRLCLACLLLAGAPAAHAVLRAAISVHVVTPSPLLPLSGGVGASTPATQQAGDLTVRALVISDATTTVALASVDLLGFPAVLGDRARARVRGVPSDHILIAATHTHSAPDPYGFPDASGKSSADIAYLNSVADRMGDAINEALAGLRPARLRMATGEVKGRIAYNAYAEALFDPRCSVLQFSSQDGVPIATLVNFAIHPEVLGSRQGICSPDLVGPLLDRVAAAGGGTGIFFNGALGGMVTADCRGPDGRDIQKWAECERIGGLLADEALRLVAGSAYQETPALACFTRAVTFPVESPILKAVLRGSPLGYPGANSDSIPTRLNLVRVGDALLLTIPGEALPNIGAYLKRKMPTEHPLLLGLCNDAFGYILTKEDWNAFPRYGYISRTCLGEKTGEIFITEAFKLIDSARQRP